MRRLYIVAVSAMLGMALAGAAGGQETLPPPADPPASPGPTTPTPASGGIDGFVFNDEDGDGVRDPGEQGLATRDVLLHVGPPTPDGK